MLSRVQIFVTPWTEAHQASPSREFSGQNPGPFPAPGDLPNTGIKPSALHLLHWQADSLPLATSGKFTLRTDANTVLQDA